MGGLAFWQIAAVALAALFFLGGMSVNVFRLFARASANRAVERPGTEAESGWYGAVAPDGSDVFDGFSYRVSARFAGRARVIVTGDRVSFTGPRGPRALYVFWIWLQALLGAAAPVAIVWAIVALEWRGIVVALALMIASVLAMAIGAGVWPGLGEVPGLTDGHYPTLEFSLSDVTDVTLGPGWANGGLRLVVLPYVAGIDRLAEGHAVSWFGPDADGREVRFALHCYAEKDAERLHALLSRVAAE